MPESDGNGKKRRKTRQRKRELYQKVREDLQLSGDLPTTVEGALRPERVDPASQTEAPQVGPVTQALRNGWAVPEHRKPDLVDELLAIVNNTEIPPKTRVAAFNALRMADREQWERDNPQQAKALGVSISNTNVQNNVTVGEVFSDIKVIEASFERITGGAAKEEADVRPAGLPASADSQAARGVRADGDAQPLDEAQPHQPQEEPEAD